MKTCSQDESSCQTDLIADLFPFFFVLFGFFWVPPIFFVKILSFLLY